MTGWNATSGLQRSRLIESCGETSTRGFAMTQPMQADVVVVGSGGSGFIAALSAATSGAEVVLLEGARFWGGTTAVSGAQLWIPNNHRMADIGVTDSLEDAFAYCSAHTMARDPGLIEAFLHAAPEMARFVEQHSPLEFQACAVPDSFAEQPADGQDDIWSPSCSHWEILGSRTSCSGQRRTRWYSPTRRS